MNSLIGTRLPNVCLSNVMFFLNIQENGRLASTCKRVTPQIVMVAMANQKDFSLEKASQTLRNNRAVILITVGRDGRALKWAAQILKQDQRVVLVAVQQDGWALQYASQQ